VKNSLIGWPVKLLCNKRVKLTR